MAARTDFGLPFNLAICLSAPFERFFSYTLNAKRATFVALFALSFCYFFLLFLFIGPLFGLSARPPAHPNEERLLILQRDLYSALTTPTAFSAAWKKATNSARSTLELTI